MYYNDSTLPAEFKNKVNSEEDNSDLLKFISPALSRRVDIFSTATREFLEWVVEIELAIDNKTRANIALQILTQYFNDGMGNCILKLSYPEIINVFLAQCKQIDLPDLSTWRLLYLVSRSIPDKYDSQDWVVRLARNFLNTYLIEGYPLNTYVLDNPAFKLRYKKGSTKNGKAPIDHNVLTPGRGENVADYYYFDDSIEGSTAAKMKSVECKISYRATLQADIDWYKQNPTSLHFAKIVLFYRPDVGWFEVDYNKPVPSCKERNDIQVPNFWFNFK